MLLSDSDLRIAIADGALSVVPTPNETQIQPASIDLRLDLSAGVLVPVIQGTDNVVSITRPPRLERSRVDMVGQIARYRLPPGGFALMSTIETVSLGSTLAARVEGRSTFGRMGLTAHVTAGFIDPGFRGTITLELANLGPWDIELDHGVRIAQLCVYTLSSPSARPYGHVALGSKYQDQAATTAPRTEKAV